MKMPLAKSYIAIDQSHLLAGKKDFVQTNQRKSGFIHRASEAAR